MPNINPASGQVVADDLRVVFSNLDASVQTTARLVDTFIQASEGADLAPVVTQRALKSMGESLNKFIDGRADMISAQKVLISIKQNSNLDVFDYGCWQRAMGASETPVTVATERQIA